MNTNNTFALQAKVLDIITAIEIAFDSKVLTNIGIIFGLNVVLNWWC